MRYFVCLLDPERRGIGEGELRAYEALPRARGLTFQWHFVGDAAVLTAWDTPPPDPLVVRDEGHVAAGIVRLDNRQSLECWCNACAADLPDLALVLHTVTRYGPQYVPQFLGDFGCVIWNDATKTAVAMCDAFRIKKVYYAERNGLVAFASRAEALALDERYSVEFLAKVVAACVPSPSLSVYEGVRSVPAGTMALLESGRLSLRRYWSPEEFEPEPVSNVSEHEAADALRRLLAEAVRLRLSHHGDTWAQLSGGLDSSSVVSVTQWLLERGDVPHGLAGTVTYVDQQGTSADEREYSTAVVNRWRVRNETVVDPPMWDDERFAPPNLDQPRVGFMLYPRERRLCEIVQIAGGRVLLTGQGGDELLRGNMFFFADWLARGRIAPAVREMARRAAIGHVSFWRLVYRNAIAPLLPRRVQLWLAHDETRLSEWVHPGVAARYNLGARQFEGLLYAGRIGHKYHDAVVMGLAAVGPTIGYVVLEDLLDVRHPFFYRPLIEFGLRLPPELCVRPHARKWVLREAMQGILPELVRTRVGKGGPTQCYARSFTAHHSLLEPLVRDSMLADLGVVDGTALRAAFDAMPNQPERKGDPHTTLQGVLAIEAWLQMRSGRWPRGGHHSCNRSATRVHSPSAEGLQRRIV